MNQCKNCQHYGEICDVSKTPPDSWCDKYLVKIKVPSELIKVCDDYFKEAK
jgi:hypothetical protein